MEVLWWISDNKIVEWIEMHWASGLGIQIHHYLQIHHCILWNLFNVQYQRGTNILCLLSLAQCLMKRTKKLGDLCSKPRFCYVTLDESTSLTLGYLLCNIRIASVVSRKTSCEAARLCGSKVIRNNQFQESKVCHFFQWERLQRQFREYEIVHDVDKYIISIYFF